MRLVCDQKRTQVRERLLKVDVLRGRLGPGS